VGDFGFGYESHVRTSVAASITGGAAGVGAAWE